jgi:trimethylamine:corrinoid methyltransferase-like protein
LGDHGSIRTWQQADGLDTFARAKARVMDLLAAYEPPALPSEVEREAKKAGMDKLPALP